MAWIFILLSVVARAETCPPTPGAWDVFFQKTAVEIYSNNLGARESRVREANERAQSCLKSLNPAISAQITKCAARKLKLNQALVDLANFTIAETPATIPEELVGAEFQRDVFAGRIDKVISYVTSLKKGYVVVPFQASIEGLGSESKRRLMIFDPGPPRKYMAYVLPTEKERATSKNGIPSNISIIQVDEGSKLNFADYEPADETGTGRKLRKHTSPGAKVECMNCHSNGPMQFVQPQKKYLDGVFGRTLSGAEYQTIVKNADAVNATMVAESYKVPFDDVANEPMIGDSIFPMDDALISKCTDVKREDLPTQLASESIGPGTRKNVKAMLNRCSKCHDGMSTMQKPLPALAVLNNPEYYKNHIYSGNMPRSPSSMNSITLVAPIERWLVQRCLEYWVKGDQTTPGALVRNYTREKCDPSSDLGKYLFTPEPKALPQLDTKPALDAFGAH